MALIKNISVGKSNYYKLGTIVAELVAYLTPINLSIRIQCDLPKQGFEILSAYVVAK